jgi:hypothetical protein
VLNAEHHDPSQQLPLQEIVLRVVALAQTLLEKPFYHYQIELASRIVESLLDHDGDVLTSLMSRQAGKTEAVGGICAAIAIILPYLAKKYPNDWRLNITDDAGNYRGFKFGVKIGIYAPRQDQAEITFERVTRAMETKSTAKVMASCSTSATVNNGNTFELTNGSRILCQSASEQSKIEGETHHLLIIEEAQDVSDLKVRKSLHPMVASTMGTILKIGTASTQKCDFYSAIQENKRLELLTGKRNHYFFPWTVCTRYNSLYRKYIEKEKVRIGQDSDDFRMSYNGEWIFERGMFITPDGLFRKDIAITQGLWSLDLSSRIRHYAALKHYSIVAGIDWGSSGDSTVMCLIAVDWVNPLESGSIATAEGNRDFVFYKKHVLGFFEWVGDNYETQYHEIMAVLNSIPNLRKVTTDSNACGKPMFDRLSASFGYRKVLVDPFNFQAKLKSDGYKSLSGDLSGGRVTFPAGPEIRKTLGYRKFVQQMLDLKKDYRNGLMQVAHPDERGAHDDYPDGFMMAAWGANTPALMETDFQTSNPFFN